MDVRKDILWRVYLCFLGIIALALTVLGRVAYIQNFQGKHWKSMGDSMHLKYLPLEGERGTIYSEDGNMLSTSVPIFDIYVDFSADGLREKNGKRFKDNLDSLSICLSKLFNDRSKDDYKRLLQMSYENEDRYFPLKKKISFEQYMQLRDFPLVRLGKNKSGFIFDQRDKRINPYVLLANRTIGLSRDDNSKNVGLEQSYDSLLRGKTGQRLVRYIAGAYMPVDGGEVEAENGKDIITTLDTYMQDVTESALMKMMSGNNSLHGTAIVMETATGKIKAIANLGKQTDGSYIEDLNYGIGKRTEPGSIFKLATLLSLIEDKYVGEDSLVNCEGGRKEFYGLRITDSHLGTGTITVKEAFAMSSNVAFAKLADKYYHNQPSKFVAHLHALRLDTLTGVDITASSGYPIIKKASSKSWSATTIPFMAHGYEELVTPLNMLMLYNSVANNGKMMKPYLVNSVKEYGVTVKEFHPTVVVEKICSDQTLVQLKDCLQEVVNAEHGTAHKIKDSAYNISGKTGTAVTAMNNKGYNKGNKIYQSSFIGFFPSEKPIYTIAVVVQNSNESKLIYGGSVSAPVFKEISDKIYYRYLSTKKFTTPVRRDSAQFNFCGYGLKDEFNTIYTGLNIPYIDSTNGGYWRLSNMKAGNTNLSVPTALITPSKVVPNVLGMGLKDAVYLLENKGLKVIISGRGKVLSQSLNAGTTFNNGQKILLYLN